MISSLERKENASMDSVIDTRAVLLRAFPGLPANQAEMLLAVSRQNTYPAEMILCHEGALESTFYILLDGEVRVTKWFDESEERILKHLHPGDFFGEMALFDRDVRSASVRALGSARILTVDKHNLLPRIHQDPSMAFRMLEIMSNRIRELLLEVNRLTDLTKHNNSHL